MPSRKRKKTSKGDEYSKSLKQKNLKKENLRKEHNPITSDEELDENIDDLIIEEFKPSKELVAKSYGLKIQLSQVPPPDPPKPKEPRLRF